MTAYCTVAELKHPNRLNINDSDSVADEMLEAIAEAASRAIDNETGRSFGIDSDEVSRYFTALSYDKLFPGDMASPSSDIVVAIDQDGDGVYETTFASTDFHLAPYDAEDKNEPYQKIEIASNGTYLFPKGVRKAVKVTSKFGWPAVPAPIKQATLLQAQRLFKRGATTLGSQSMTALGKQMLTIPKLDPDIEKLISIYMKTDFG